MTEKIEFDFNSGIVSSDNFNLEVKGYFENNATAVSDVKVAFSTYANKHQFTDILSLIEKEDISSHDVFSSLSLKTLKIVTLNAIRTEDQSEKYAINPDLEGQKKKKGLFGRFKRG